MKWDKLDEREVMVMLKARHYAFSVVFVILAGSLIIKAYILGLPLSQYITEVVALIIGGGVEVVMDARKGFFDPAMKPTIKTYFLSALVGALIFSVAFGAGRWYQIPMFRERLDHLLLVTAIMFVSLFLLIFVALACFGTYAKHRQKRLAQELEEEED